MPISTSPPRLRNVLPFLALLWAGCGGSGDTPVQPPPDDDAPIQIPARGTAATFDVGAWNVEWFGDTGNGPANELLQAQRVRDVIQGTDLDLWGVEEVVSASAFSSLVTSLNGYAGLLANDASVENGAAYYSDFGGQEQKVGLIYKTTAVEVLGARVILTSYDHAFAGRPPLEVRVRITTGTTPVVGVVIVLHAKAGADADSWQRRQTAAAALETYLDDTWPQAPVWVIGDFNDDVDTSILGGQPSPYANFVTAPTWSFATASLSQAGVASTVGYSDIIDHHLVSDEALAMLVAGSAEAYRVDTYIAEYGTTTSDHYPVLTRYSLN